MKWNGIYAFLNLWTGWVGDGDIGQPAKAQCVPQMLDLHPALLLNLGSGNRFFDVVEVAMEHVLVFPKRNCEYWLRGAESYFPVPRFQARISRFCITYSTSECRTQVSVAPHQHNVIRTITFNTTIRKMDYVYYTLYSIIVSWSFWHVRALCPVSPHVLQHCCLALAWFWWLPCCCISWFICCSTADWVSISCPSWIVRHPPCCTRFFCHFLCWFAV